jgi:hypothetical protein
MPMPEVYVVCLMLGGAMIALSIFAGGEVDADADLDADLAPDADGDVGELQGEGLAAAARFLSIRNLVFGVAFFGLTGCLLSLGGVPQPVTLPVSMGVGLLAGASLQRLMDYLRGSESGEITSLRSVEGAHAEVVVGLEDGRPGKVVVATHDQTHELVARIHEEASVRRLEPGVQVLIVRIDEGVALVAEADFAG